jgi:hypothetical protein
MQPSGGFADKEVGTALPMRCALQHMLCDARFAVADGFWKLRTCCAALLCGEVVAVVLVGTSGVGSSFALGAFIIIEAPARAQGQSKTQAEIRACGGPARTYAQCLKVCACLEGSDSKRYYDNIYKNKVRAD